MFQKLVIQKLGADTGCFKNSRRRIGCQEVKLLSVLRTKIASLFSLPSCPLNFCSSDNDTLPCPPPREGACSRKSNPQANNCHCERQNGASQSHNIYINNEITTSNASHSPRNDIESLCKTQVVDGTATFPRNDIENSCNTQYGGWSGTLPKGARGIDLLIPSLEGSANERRAKRRCAGDGVAVPLFANEQDRGSKGVGENQPSPQSTGEGVSKKLVNHRCQSDILKLLKQVQDDLFNLLKPTYSLINLFSYSPRKRAAFTLAEVLLTLGIIGVVAAMTMPVLITNHQKQKTVSYVRKFYNEINNAVRMAVVDNGDVELWVEDYRTSDYNANLQFVQNYILPYIKYLRVDNCYETRVCVYLSYGMFTYNVDSNGGDIAFFINSKYEIFPKNYFGFQFNKRNDNPNLGNRPTVEPYVYKWDGDYNPPESNTLKTASWGGCNTSAGGDAKYAYCTKWIQLNDWKIPDDYPWNAKE